jgi:hypothetical protein
MRDICCFALHGSRGHNKINRTKKDRNSEKLKYVCAFSITSGSTMPVIVIKKALAFKQNLPAIKLKNIAIKYILRALFALLLPAAYVWEITMEPPIANADIPF